MRSLIIALVCLCCLCIVTIVDAEACRVWHVPGDADTLPEALALAQPRDIIELDIGHHKIVGRDHLLKAGVTIRSSLDLPGACVLEETPGHPGDWRDHPVFILDDPGEPCRFEGITFQHWTLSDGPYQYISNPIFHVVAGTIEFRECRWLDFYKYAIYFSGGSGLVADCEFAYGCGCPSAISFGGEQLTVTRTLFHHLTWVYDCDSYQGSIIRLRDGEATVNCCDFRDNGPVIHMLMIDRNATLHADHSCLACNLTAWEARVAGQAFLDCCEVDLALWQIVEGGELVILDDPAPAKAMATETRSWSQVKDLFD